MKITLKELHQSITALNRVAEEKPESAKIAYRLGRVVKSARAEIETLLEHQNELLKKYGTPIEAQPGYFAFENGTREKYEVEWKDLLTTEVEVWGDGFQVGDMEGLHLSVDEYSKLDWLIRE